MNLNRACSAPHQECAVPLLTASEAFKALYGTVVRLRGEGGCKWDREQTPSTLRGDLIEETYECLEAINENDPVHVAEELGDLYLLVTMIAYMHEQEGKFTVADTLENIKNKLIRRHPHVFGDVKVNNVSEILDNWAAIKVQQEGRRPKDSILDEVSSGIPPMDRAFALQKKAAKAGFDWPDMEGVISKIYEEIEEVRLACGKAAACLHLQNASGAGNALSGAGNALSGAGNAPSGAGNALSGAGNALSGAGNALSGVDNAPSGVDNALSGVDNARVEEELGDLLFSCINLCRFLKTDPSVALCITNGKFVHRFKQVESKMKEAGYEMKKENIDIMDRFWNESKE